jgi:predicted DNA-binding transcriptional regulator AlpA
MNGSVEKQSFSIQHFCITHGISRATFYNLIKKHLAPRLMKVGKRTLISAEATAEWRARMEQKTGGHSNESK